MTRLRVLVAATVLAFGSMLVSAAPANASCAGEPIDACAAICQVGLGNKYTHDLFAFCYAW